MHEYSCVYILSNNRNTVLYVGVTANLVKRIWDHKHKSYFGFTSKYNVDKLVYYEFFEDIINAIIREKQLKGGSRQNKIELINKFNPEWKDLYSNII
jgi:putative endonuclease